MDINQSDTLQRKSAREEKDERHICPLQLEVIRRCVELWTNPGDIVYDPFGGIGSTSYVALQLGRRAIASELKESYYKQMVANCAQAQVNQDSVQTVGDGILHQLTFFKKIFLFERIVKQNIKKSSNIFLRYKIMNEKKQICINCGISGVPLEMGLDGHLHCVNCAGFMMFVKEVAANGQAENAKENRLHEK